MTRFSTSEIEWLKAEYSRCWPWLEAALKEHPDTYRREDVWADIASGHAQFWPLKGGAMVTTIFTYPTGRRELRGWLAGGDLNEIVDAEPHVAQWAKDAGCVSILLTGRRGWRRAFKGYHEAATFLRREL
jgi:hypothetical protein